MYTGWEMDLIFLGRLMLSILVGGVLGWERERNNKSAGLKTHILLAIAGCLLMWLSLYAFDEFQNHVNARFDPARLAAQVGGGIGGFVAAGIVFRSDSFSISGYSTAATLLLAMILGFAIGGGQYFVGLVTAFVVTFLMLWLTPLKKRIHRPYRRHLTYVSIDRPSLLADVSAILGSYGINIADVRLEVEGEVVTTRMEICYPDQMDWDMLVSKLTQVPNVISVVLEKDQRKIINSDE